MWYTAKSEVVGPMKDDSRPGRFAGSVAIKALRLSKMSSFPDHVVSLLLWTHDCYAFVVRFPGCALSTLPISACQAGRSCFQTFMQTSTLRGAFSVSNETKTV